MRKTPKYFITAALAIMTLAGCGNENNEPEVTGRKDCPDFTATISGVQTRAFNQQWEQEDEIGISGANRTNVCYHTKGGDGIFTVETNGEQIYFKGEDEVTFTAYYPWDALAGGATTVNADTRRQASQKSFDFLWAHASGKKAAPTVTFNFAHRMAKVVLTIKPGKGMSYDEIKAARLSLKGFRHTGTFNVADGSTAVKNDNEGDWTFTEGDAYKAPAVFDDAQSTATYSLIFFPQTLQEPMAFLAELPENNNFKAEIDFTKANSEKDGASAKNEWVAGRQYNLSVTLNRTSITLGECVINPWTVVGENISVD